MFTFQGRDAPVLVLIEQTRGLVNGIDISKNQNCEKPNRITFSILIGLIACLSVDRDARIRIESIIRFSISQFPFFKTSIRVGSIFRGHDSSRFMTRNRLEPELVHGLFQEKSWERGRLRRHISLRQILN